jgi:hypothetical protein
MRIRAFGALALAASLVPVAGCGSSTPLADTLPVVAPTPTTETLTGSLACCLNSDIKPFTIAQSGNVDITLTALTINGAPSTISMILAVGVPSGTSCSLLTGGVINGPAGASGTANIAELSGGPLPAGAYCVQVTDVGNVPPNTTVNYTVTVMHT